MARKGHSPSSLENGSPLTATIEILASSLSLIATQARVCSEAGLGDLWESVRKEAKESLDGVCFMLGKPVGFCDLVESKERGLFVCRTCEVCWYKNNDGAWLLADWDGKFPWEV